MTPKSTSTTALASLWPTAANRPVSDDELDELPGRISNHFNRVRDLLKQIIDATISAGDGSSPTTI
jgi:hypothetical protein